MHIPGKPERAKRHPLNRFFQSWALRRHLLNKKPEMRVSALMDLPHAQKVAEIAGIRRRLNAWRKSCEQANAIAEARRIERAERRLSALATA